MSGPLKGKTPASTSSIPDGEELALKVERLLRFRGKRLTRQRRLLLRLIGAMSGHFDALQLHRLAQERAPRLSLSTVYRTLGLLKELEVVRELRLREEYALYELRRGDGHHHLVCLGCGRIIEFNCQHCRKIHRQLAGEYGFEIISSEVELKGYCRQCREKGVKR